MESAPARKAAAARAAAKRPAQDVAWWPPADGETARWRRRRRVAGLGSWVVVSFDHGRAILGSSGFLAAQRRKRLLGSLLAQVLTPFHVEVGGAVNFMQLPGIQLSGRKPVLQAFFELLRRRRGQGAEI